MIDHVGIDVTDYERSKKFYVEALGPLGYELVMEPVANVGGFAAKGKPDFWIASGAAGAGGVHLAFTADDRATVDAFHGAALAAGGKDNGQPGLREYHEHYYAAYVHDPDGNNVEAVCHLPE